MQSAFAATFTVNNNGDANDAVPGNGVCATSGGVCTLRAAIREANALAGSDTIDFSGVTLINIASQLSINTNITINGMGVTVDNTGTGRVFNLTAGAVVTINGLSVQGGAVTGSGGGIAIGGGADLVLQAGAVITNNRAGNGGGVYVTGSGSTLIVDASTIQSNQATNGAGIYATTSSVVTLRNGTQTNTNDAVTNGSGIYAGGNAQMTITGSATAVTANLSATSGSGMYLTGGADAFLQDGAVISNNAANNGGGVYINGNGTTLSVTDGGVIRGNSAGSRGAGVFMTGTSARLTLNDAVITQNNAIGNGGGVYVNTGIFTAGNARITYNTGLNGDGIFQAGGSTNVSNSCIVCNGDSAVQRSGGTTPMTLGGNWWGSAWGPHYNSATNGLQCSTSDSLGTAQPLANYGISVTTPIVGVCRSVAPAGNWLTATTAGCTGAEINRPSSVGHARTCSPP